MGEIVAEQKGGAVGAGVGSVRTESRLPLSALSDADRARLDLLFQARKKVNGSLYYRLTRSGPNGQEQVDAEPSDVPKPLIDNLKTTLE